MSRQIILDRLRRNPISELAPPTAPKASAAPAEQLSAPFLRAWEGLGGTWEQHDSATAARLGLLLTLRERKASDMLSWSPHNLGIPDLGPALSDAGFTLVPPERRHLNPDISLGLTGADAALAATGSLIFTPAAGRSWLPALIPISHIILLPASRIHADLTAWRQAWNQSERSADLCRSLIVTGPSFSDDIALHRRRGMFGPRYMHLILFEDA